MMDELIEGLQNFEYDMTVPPEDIIIEAPWNKGRRGDKCPGVAEANRRRVWTDEQKKKLSEGKKGKINVGRKRPDLAERNRKRKGQTFPRDENGRFKSL